MQPQEKILILQTLNNAITDKPSAKAIKKELSTFPINLTVSMANKRFYCAIYANNQEVFKIDRSLEYKNSVESIKESIQIQVTNEELRNSLQKEIEQIEHEAKAVLKNFIKRFQTLTLSTEHLKALEYDTKFREQTPVYQALKVANQSLQTVYDNNFKTEVYYIVSLTKEDGTKRFIEKKELMDNEKSYTTLLDERQRKYAKTFSNYVVEVHSAKKTQYTWTTEYNTFERSAIVPFIDQQMFLDELKDDLTATYGTGVLTIVG